MRGTASLPLPCSALIMTDEPVTLPVALGTGSDASPLTVGRKIVSPFQPRLPNMRCTASAWIFARRFRR